MNLEHLQRAFGDALLGRDSPIAEAIVDDTPGYAVRLHVYRNHFLVSMQEALLATYPRCCQFLEKDLFRELTRSYVQRHPPQECCMVNYGQGFADYVGEIAGLENGVIAADLARLEWEMERCSLAPPVRAFPFERLGEVDPEDYDALILRPADSLRIWSAACAVDVLFDALVNEQLPPPGPPEPLEPINLLAVHRAQGVAVSRATPGELALLTLCFEEKPLAAYPEGLGETVLVELTSLLGRGLIEDFSLRR